MAVSGAERTRRWRERQAAGREVVRLVPKPLEARLLPSVERSLAALDLGPQDAALAAICRAYPRQVDELADEIYAVRRFGPL